VTGGRGFVEHFRLDADGRFDETQFQLVTREDAYASRNEDQAEGWGAWGWGAGNGRSYYPSQGWQPESPQPPQPAPATAPPPRPLARGLFAPWSDPDDA